MSVAAKICGLSTEAAVSAAIAVNDFAPEGLTSRGAAKQGDEPLAISQPQPNLENRSAAAE